MKIRLDKMLGNLGYGTRSKLKKEIKNGCVKVNGVVAKDSSLIIDTEDDVIKLYGEEVIYKQYVYIMMNKSQGVISATEDYYNTKTVIDLLDDRYKVFKPFPVGRLDKDTEGLLLLTNNGKMCHNLLSPKKHVDKKYYVHVRGKLDKSDIYKFREGVVFLDDGYKTMPADLEIVLSDEISECYVTIKEGKFHQVKRMFEAIDKTVVYLKRISMGQLKLDESLELGRYRELNSIEMSLLEEYK